MGEFVFVLSIAPMVGLLVAAEVELIPSAAGCTGLVNQSDRGSPVTCVLGRCRRARGEYQDL